MTSSDKIVGSGDISVFQTCQVWLQNHQANGCKTKVIGAPKTIDGDLKYLWRFSRFSCDRCLKDD